MLRKYEAQMDADMKASMSPNRESTLQAHQVMRTHRAESCKTGFCLEKQVQCACFIPLSIQGLTHKCTDAYWLANQTLLADGKNAWSSAR